MTHQTMASWLIAGSIFLVPAAQAARVTVIVDGIHGRDGTVMVGLADSAATFPRTFIRGASAAARPLSVTLIFENVKPGRYALSAYHDRNGNGKLDLGAFGIPQEPFGFSRDARGAMGPPSFDAAAFDVTAAGISLVIHLK